jgi:hypothetical protein
MSLYERDSFLCLLSTCRGTPVLVFGGIMRRLCVDTLVVVCCIISTNNSNNMADRDDHNFMKVSRIGPVEYMFQINFSRTI